MSRGLGLFREETTKMRKRRHPVAVVLALGAYALLAGCAARETAPVAAPPATAAQLPAWRPPEGWAPGPIPRQEYAARRAALARELGDGVFVTLGALEPEHDYLSFAQTSSFRYLTGITEPGAALVLAKSGGRVDELVFVRPRDPAREVWEGHRLGTEGAQALTGAPARISDRLLPTLDSLLATHRTLYTLVPVPTGRERGRVLNPEQQILAQVVAPRPGVQVTPVGEVVERLRAAKSPAELELIRAAVYSTNLAHRQAQRAIEPGMNEFEVEGVIAYTFRRNGAERPAFASIVGSGPNSTTLHYNRNDRFMQAGDVVVMDVGASYRGYSADVTRTVPVSGRFSPEQRSIYETVLAAQKAAEARVRPGATWEELNEAANREIAEGLARLGLIDSPAATYLCESPRFGNRCPQFRLYFMHGLGHGVGLDVHDPDVSYFGPFREGSAFTIEPGIYVRADALDYLPDSPENRAMADRLRPAVERYTNTGVRIEDTYILTARGAERVSAGAPREIAEVEAMLATERTERRDRQPAVVESYRRTEPRER